MELIIAELSRYIIVILFALYTFYSYRAFIGRAAGNNEGVFRAQRVLIVMLHLVCSAVILVEEKEIKYVVLWALELFFFLFFTKIYQVFYKGMSRRGQRQSYFVSSAIALSSRQRCFGQAAI